MDSLKRHSSQTHPFISGASTDSAGGTSREIIIVEGESASLAVQRVCDKSFQAVFPMQGKPLNAWRASPASVLRFSFYRELLEEMGMGGGEEVDTNRRRYERVLILTDPDADGVHCGALLLLFFYKWLKPWIDEGRLEQVHAPKCQISAAGMGEPRQIYTDEGVKQLLDALKQRGIQDIKKQSYRGLASLSADVLHKYCVAPATRKSRVLTQEDADQAVFFLGGGK